MSATILPGSKLWNSRRRAGKRPSACHPPRNPDYAAGAEEHPPLLVKCHGGATSAASSTQPRHCGPRCELPRKHGIRPCVFAAFSLEHAFLASVCGIVSAAVAVALLAQMDRTIDSAARQATISAMATFIGDVFAHSSHFPPQWAEPTVTAAVSGGIAIALWYAKRWAKSL
jgi:hypothetical protein